MLRPESNVELNTAPVDSNLDAPRHHIFLSNSVEHDVDGADEDLPDAVETEETAEDIKVFSLKCRRPPLSLLHVFHVVKVEKQLPRKFF